MSRNFFYFKTLYIHVLILLCKGKSNSNMDQKCFPILQLVYKYEKMSRLTTRGGLYITMSQNVT